MTNSELIYYFECYLVNLIIFKGQMKAKAQRKRPRVENEIKRIKEFINYLTVQEEAIWIKK